MKKYKDSIKTVLVIALIALAAGLLLSVVNSFTQVDEEAILMEKIALAYDSPIDRELNTENYVNQDDSEIFRAYLAQDGAVIILAHSKRAYDASGLELLVIIKDNIIIDVVRYRASETPGVGTRALATEYLANYVNLNVSQYEKTELNRGSDSESIKNIDAISSVTVTSKAVNIAVNGAIAFYNTLQLDSISGEGDNE